MEPGWGQRVGAQQPGQASTEQPSPSALLGTWGLPGPFQEPHGLQNILLDHGLATLFHITWVCRPIMTQWASELGETPPVLEENCAYGLPLSLSLPQPWPSPLGSCSQGGQRPPDRG